MGLLSGKKPDADAPSVESLTAENATLVATNATLVEAAKASARELTDLRGFKANADNLVSLQTQASALGFTGDVATLLADAKGNYGDACAALIPAFTAELAEREEVHVDAHSEEDLGDDAPPIADAPTPKTKSDAMQLVRSTYNLKGKEVTLKARELYPDLMGGK